MLVAVFVRALKRLPAVPHADAPKLIIESSPATHETASPSETNKPFVFQQAESKRNSSYAEYKSVPGHVPKMRHYGRRDLRSGCSGLRFAL